MRWAKIVNLAAEGNPRLIGPLLWSCDMAPVSDRCVLHPPKVDKVIGMSKAVDILFENSNRRFEQDGRVLSIGLTDTCVIGIRIRIRVNERSSLAYGVSW